MRSSPRSSKPSRRARASHFIEDEIYGGFEPVRQDIIVPEHVGTPTGILDANGNEIVRQPRPIGFGRWQ